MQYAVPQFIDIEDKIILSLTWTQAAWVFGSGGATWVIFVIIQKINPETSLFLKLIFASPIIALGLALAFLKINKRPFIDFLEALLKYYITPRKYLWRKQEQKKKKTIVEHNRNSFDTYVPEGYDVPVINKRSRIKDLAWSLDMDS